MAEPSIAIYGDNCIDRYRLSEPPDYVGGNAVNVAVHLAALGARAAYFGITGDDEEGELVSRSLAGRGVDCTHLAKRHGRTAVTFIELNQGDRVFVAEDLGVECPLQLPPADLRELASHRYVHCTGFTSWKLSWQTAQPAIVEEIAFLKSRSVFVSFDFSDQREPPLAHLIGASLGVVFVSCPSDSSHEHVEQTVRYFLNCGVKEVVVTLGSAGALHGDGRDTTRVPASITDPVDTLGAGDAFIAAWLWGHMLGEPRALSMLRATRLAGSVCLHPGAWPAAEARGIFNSGDKAC